MLKEFTPPDSELLWKLTAGYRLYFDPRFHGLENINPMTPSLFVGNHTIFGLIDSPLLLAGIYKYTGVYPRALGDHFHFKVPGWGKAVTFSGGVEGTPENCRELMSNGEHVLVFPGGAREVAKRKGEEYVLTWKKRTGFARMAIEFGYPIIPFASVGPDEMFDIIWDADDILESPFGKWLKKTKWWSEKEGLIREGDIIMPIVRGLGLTNLPRPERFYFGFAKPIDTKRFKGDCSDENLWQLREETAEAIEKLIDDLMVKREEDDKPGLLRRILTK